MEKFETNLGRIWVESWRNFGEILDEFGTIFILVHFWSIFGQFSGSAEALFNEGGFTHDFTFEDGAIGKEFKEQIEQIRAEEELRKNKELVESQKLIEAIQLEENNSDFSNPDFIQMQKQVEAEIEQRKRDEELARRLQEEQEPGKEIRIIWSKAVEIIKYSIMPFSQFSRRLSRNIFFRD